MAKVGGAPKCPRCSKSVYAAEQQLANGRAFHKSCFSCAHCKKKLDSTTLCERESEIYCKSCYGGSFGPTGFRSGGQGAMMNTQEKEAEQAFYSAPGPTPSSTAKGSSSGGGGAAGAFCSSCGAKRSGLFCSGCGTRFG
eukprot:TRINITY_DN4202_c0_g1_i1.p1 TRINITY_DN4202_c0_g1~~TRINITY_DN4202_c0_g1_i1.p1  ORF type:complete len:150 (-),score=41.52 TRINITY_DN4202_c0_g1_i1:61-477(-)